MSLSPSSRIVVMGVSGSGKSTVAQLLATRLGLPFIEGDAWHPPRNVELMAAGQALTDEDRRDWLAALADQLRRAQDTGGVLACSALKRSYRNRLREGAPGLRLVHLTGSPGVLAQRLQLRQGHYMPPKLLQSQLDTLEPPSADEHAVVLNIELPPNQLVETVCRHWDLDRR
jgi:carbohydrate kinase (thermoresistant glucokinase family)